MAQKTPADKSPVAGKPKAKKGIPDDLKQVGKYEIRKKIGAGGMGAVFLAEDPILRRKVALKILPPDKAENPILVKRFHAEARAAAALRHENIVNVYEAGEVDGLNFIALEYVEGKDLAYMLEQRGVIPVKRATDIIKQLARALDHAASQSIVHRDIKPANVLIRLDGVVKLTDLGLARALDDAADTSITRAGTTVGTVDYMAPEQAANSKAADIRSDIYSLGCTFYHMLTGMPPFPDGSVTNKLFAHKNAPRPDPRQKNTRVPEGLVAIVQRMMASTPEQRYQSAGELLSDLQNPGLSNKDMMSAMLNDVAEDDAAIASVEVLDDDASDVPAPARSRRKAAADDDEPAPAPRRRKSAPVEDAGDVDYEAPVERSSERTKKNRSTSASNNLDTDERPKRKLPKREESLRGDDETEEKDYTNLKLAGLGVVGVAVVGGLIYLISQFAGGFGGNDATANPFKKGAEFGGPEQKKMGAPVLVNAGGQQAAGPGSPFALDASRAGQNTGATKIDLNSGVGPNGQPLPAGAAASAVAEPIKTEVDFLPKWVLQPRPVADLTPFTVRVGGSGENVFPTLNAALAAVKAPGATITLTGKGPFELRPMELAEGQRVVIQGQETVGGLERPLVVLLPAENPGITIPDAVLQLRNTTLDLRGMHLVLDAAAWKSPLPRTVVRSSGADVYLTHSTLTVAGTPSAPITAFEMEGQLGGSDRAPLGQTRFLLENSLVRGQNLTLLAAGMEKSDMVLHGSLAYSGQAPAIQFSAAAENRKDAGRGLKLVTSTVISSTSAVAWLGFPEKHAPTSLTMFNSLVAAPQGSSQATLLSLHNWDREQAKRLLGSSLTWQSDSSLYLGWERLIGSTSTLNVPKYPALTALWQGKPPGNERQFVSTPWPVAAFDVGGTDLAPLNRKTISLSAAQGGNPGCPVESISVVSISSLGQAQTAGARPPQPLLFEARRAGKTLRVDLQKQDLGRFIDAQVLEDGMEIVAFGAGLQRTSPVQIQGHWIRIRFEQSQGDLLQLAFKGTDRGDGLRDSALFSVTDGGLELQNATVLSNSGGTIPQWVVQAQHADLSLKNCRLQAPLVTTTRGKGVVQILRGSGEAPKRPDPVGDRDSYFLVQNSFLMSAGIVVDAQARQLGGYFRNSVLVGRDELFSLSLAGPEPQIFSNLDFDQCTLSAGGTFFRVQPAELTTNCLAPLSIAMERSVFAPPLKRGQNVQRPVVLSISAEALAQKQVSWWESHSGYAPDVGVFLGEPGKDPPAANQDFNTTWVERWGAGSVISPLTGDGGVALAEPLPEDRNKIEPWSFQLGPRAKALTWNKGRPIGADLATMRLPEINKRGPAQLKPNPDAKGGF